LLHRELQITPAEETQWAAFAQVMRDNAAQMDAAFSQRGGALATMNAVQDLQSYAQISQIQSDNMQKLATAFQTLYASFPASQQKVVDGVFRPAQVRH
jgi:protein CpxP